MIKKKLLTGAIVGALAISDRIDQRVDVSGGHKYKFQTSTKQKMINYVKERGYGYAAIVGEPSTGKQFNAHGYWSPDSI